MSYPKTMTHPAYFKSSPVVVRDARGKVLEAHGPADRFPPVTVQNEDQEERHRAQGYLSTEDAPQARAYQPFPCWMKNDDGDEKLAETAATETLLAKLGYARKGTVDPEAVERAFATPYDPNHVPQEWPKMVDGVLTQDPNADHSATEYPKWVKHPEGMDLDILVKNRAEEAEARAKLGLPEIAAPVVATKPVLVVDERRATMAAVAKIRGIMVGDEMTADDIEAALFAPPKDDEKAELLAEAERRGVKVDKRWNAEKLRQALEAA